VKKIPTADHRNVEPGLKLGDLLPVGGAAEILTATTRMQADGVDPFFARDLTDIHII